MSFKIFDKPMLERALNASWARNQVIAENIANVDTPGYKRKDVNFDEYLKAAMNKDGIAGFVSDPRHISINGGTPANSSSGSENESEVSGGTNLKVTRDFSETSMRMDGNNVDVDKEMAELAKNQISFDAYSQLMNSHFSKLRNAIREGR